MNRILTILSATIVLSTACTGGGDRSSTPPVEDAALAPTGSVSESNRAPVAVNDFRSTTDSSVSVSVLANDSDPDGDSLSILFTGRPSNGSVQIDDNGTSGFTADDALVYTARDGFTGTDVFSYTIADGNDGRANAYVTVNVGSAGPSQPAEKNQEPIANSDEAATQAPQPVTIDVLSNDTDGDLERLSLFSFSAPANGSVQLDDNGTPEADDDQLIYSPNPGFSGIDTLTYSVTDGIDVATGSVRVSVSLTPVISDPAPVPNPQPLPQDDTAQACGVVTLGPINDALVSAFNLSAEGLAIGGVLATARTGPDGRWCMSLPEDRDNVLIAARGGFFPDPADSRYLEGAARLIWLDDRFALETVLPADAAFASLTVFSNAVLRKSRRETQGEDFDTVWAQNRQQAEAAFGFDVFTTDVADPVLPVNDADNVSRTYAMAVGAAATSLNQIAVDLDVAAPNYLLVDALIQDLSECRLDGRDALGPVTVRVGGDLRPISDNINLNLQILRFRNNLTSVYAGVPLLQVDQPVCEQAVIAADTTAPRFVSLPDNLVLLAPGAGGVDATAPAVSNFLAAASAEDDRDGVVPVNVSLANGGALPAVFLPGTTMLAFTATDAAGNVSETVIRSIEAGVVGPPLAFADQAVTDEDTSVNVSLLANDLGQNAPLEPSTVQLEAPALHGEVQIDPVTGTASYVPQAEYFGVDVFEYSVADTSGERSEPARVEITVVAQNDAPAGRDDVVTTDESTSILIDVLANDIDVENAIDPGSLELLSAPGSGVATVDFVTSSVVYAPTPGFIGTDVFTYRFADQQGERSAETTVSVVVVQSGTVANLAPQAINDFVSVSEDTPIDINVVDNDVDEDGQVDAGSVRVIESPVHGTLSPATGSGSITYIPATNYFGPDQFSYQIADDLGLWSDPATVFLNVVPVDDTPMARSDVAQGIEGEAVEVALLANDQDSDGLAGASISLVSLPSFGTAVWDPDSLRLIYTPFDDFDGSDSLQYQLTDSSGLVSAPVDVVVNVTGLNDAPVGTADAFVVVSGVPTTLDVLANDSDVDSLLSHADVEIVDAPQFGVVAYDAVADRLSYTSTADFNGADSFRYQVRDPDGAASGPVTVSLDVTTLAEAPVAVNDTVAALEQTALDIRVLDNDSDADGDLDPASVVVTGLPQFGIATPTGDGVITYISNDEFSGVDTLMYTVSDTRGIVSNTAMVTINVSNVDEPPRAIEDAVTISEDQSVDIVVLGNDIDPEGNIDTASVMIDTPPANGALVVDPVSGNVRYTPDANYVGIDQFTYTVDDTSGLRSNFASVNVTVTAVDDAPVAVSDSVSTNEDTSVVIAVLDNDTDADADPGSTIDTTTVQIDTLPVNGAVVVNPVSGAITYTPESNYAGVDQFSYTVDDGTGLRSNGATVSVTVTAVNDAPVALADSVSTDEDTSVVIAVLDNDTDVDNEPGNSINAATVQIDTTPVYGDLAVDPVTGVVTYTPNDDYAGVDQFTYTVDDRAGLRSNSAAVNVTISAVNDAPVAVEDVVSTDEDTSVDIAVLDNDTDVDGTLDATSLAITTMPANGTLTVDATIGRVTYTPAANFFGDDSFSYQVSDSDGSVSNIAAVEITVQSQNDAPVANNETLSIEEDNGVDIDILDNDEDIDSVLDVSSVVIVSAPSMGTVTVNGSTGVATYTPNADVFGDDSFTYRVSDEEGGISNIATVAITVNPVNDAPVANNDAVITDENVDAVIAVASNDTDADGSGDIASAELASPPANGSVTVGADSTELVYSPNLNFNGTDQFSYQLLDAEGLASNVATVSVTIVPMPSNPQTLDRTATVANDTVIDIRVLLDATDPENDIVESSVAIVSDVTSGATNVLPDGMVRYTPASGFVGLDMFSFQVSDATGLVSNTSVVTITVTAPATGPTASPFDAGLVFSGETAVIDLTGSVTDADGVVDFATLSVSNASQGTPVVMGSSGSVEWALPVDYVGVATFEYTVMDNDGLLSNTAEVSLLVWPAEDQDLDGVAASIELEVGTDPNAAESVYVHIDPETTAATPDGSSWNQAYASLMQASDDGRLVSSPGNTVYVLIASNSDVETLGREWQMSLASNCDDMVFVGSLDPFVVTPRAFDSGRPRTKLESVEAGQRPVTLDSCKNMRFYALEMRGGQGVEQGGGLWMSDATVTLNSVHVSNNQAISSGGGIYVDAAGISPSELTISESTIRDNTLAPGDGQDASGGGIHMVDGASLSLIDSIVRHNEAPINGSVGASESTGGGGAFVGETPLYISNTTFSANLTQQCGGGLHLSGTASMRIEHSTFSGNESERTGGGVCMVNTDANLTFHNNLVTSNFADVGGGLYIADVDKSRITNNTAVLNLAADSGGGAQIGSGGDPVISYNIAQFNQSESLSDDVGGTVGQLLGLDASYNFISSFFANFVGTDNSSALIEFDHGYYQVQSSPGVNYGAVDSDDPLFALNLRYTDRSGTTTDLGLLDAGYHYAEPSSESPNQLQIVAPSALVSNAANQKLRLAPLVNGERLGPGHRLYIRSSDSNVATHLYTYTSVVLDPLNNDDSTQLRDLGDGFYEVLLDIDDDVDSFELFIYIDSITTPSFNLQIQ